MARLDYAGTEHTPGPDGEITDRIRARRGGVLTPLDRMLLHSPPLADGWNGLLGAVRTSSTLSDDVRELAILRIAALNGADYEWRAHEPVGRAGGLTDTDLAVLRGERDAGVLVPRLAAVMAYTDAMTYRVTVADDVFDALREHFDDREVVELTVTVGTYNLVSRFLVALEVGTETQEAA
ncbi:MAG: carboxymuconolactone decarboxylase family protein [Pseudonocardia sp.]|nr:carboxymuconolactone decarboxylase family protein [Pseudonocardia sp.]